MLVCGCEMLSHILVRAFLSGTTTTRCSHLSVMKWLGSAYNVLALNLGLQCLVHKSPSGDQHLSYGTHALSVAHGGQLAVLFREIEYISGNL